MFSAWSTCTMHRGHTRKVKIIMSIDALRGLCDKSSPWKKVERHQCYMIFYSDKSISLKNIDIIIHNRSRNKPQTWKGVRLNLLLELCRWWVAFVEKRHIRVFSTWSVSAMNHVRREKNTRVSSTWSVSMMNQLVEKRGPDLYLCIRCVIW